MATFRKRNGNWTVSVRRKNYPEQYATFDTKVEAEDWAKSIETQMRKRAFVDTTSAEKTTLKHILERYSEEISTQKKGVVQEQSKIKMICKHSVAEKMLAALTTSDIAGYRDNRLSGYGDIKAVGKKTVREELNIITHSIKIASSEWHINLPRGNPAADVRKPPASKGARNRRLILNKDKTICEYQRLLKSAKKITPMEEAITLAIETGMRRSELAGLIWENVDLENRVAHLPDTKNNEARDVPLSSQAVKVFLKLEKSKQETSETVLNMFPDYITHSFIKICKNADIKDLRWHDLRHEATSRFFEIGLSALEVASITGHKTLQMLQRYTHLKAIDLAKKLK